MRKTLRQISSLVVALSSVMFLRHAHRRESLPLVYLHHFLAGLRPPKTLPSGLREIVSLKDRTIFTVRSAEGRSTIARTCGRFDTSEFDDHRSTSVHGAWR